MRSSLSVRISWISSHRILLQELLHTHKCTAHTRSTGESARVSASLFQDIQTHGFMVSPAAGEDIVLVRRHRVGVVWQRLSIGIATLAL